MANPTGLELKNSISTIVSDNSTDNAQCTDAQLNTILQKIVDHYDSLDPDRPVKVRNLSRL